MDDVLEYDDTYVDDYESDFEFDESDEMDERFRRRKRVRPRTPTGQGLYKGRPAANAVTQPQLQAALARVGQQIKAGSTATQQLASRVNTLVDRLEKEIATRKKAEVQQKKAVGSSSMYMMLPLLMMQGGSTEISDREGEKRTRLGTVNRPAGGAATTAAEVEVLRDDGTPLPERTPAQAVTQNTKFKSSSNDMLMPMVMMMAMGGMGGGTDGSDNSQMMMMMMMVMMMQKKN